MKQFRDILVYAETHDPGCLEQVVAVAVAHGAAITVCEIVEAPPQKHDSRGIVDRLSNLRGSRALQRLRHICDLFTDQTFIDYSVFTGVPFETITQQVIEQDFDLVVHISDALHVDHGVGLNATGMHLMRKCPCTVWALHPERNPHSNNVVLALDREVAEGTRTAEAFAMTLAETALALAETRNGDVHVIHAWQPYGVELLDDDELALTQSERQFYLRQQREDTEQWFKRVVQRIESIAEAPITVKSHLVEGPAVPAVEHIVKDKDAGMLVLGTVGTSANPGVLIGATTESILAGVGTAVLAMKPPGYVSPLAMGLQHGAD